MEKLTPKQELFCQEYIKDLNGKQAAIRAKYAPNSAEVQASRMLINVKVQARIAELQAVALKANKIDAQWVLRQAVEVYNRCMQVNPVLVKGEPTGSYKFDSSGANRALELIGKHADIAAFGDNSNSKGDLSGLTPWSSITVGIDR